MALASYRFGPFLLDPAARELLRDARPLVMPARAFECLLHLIEHRDRAVSRDELAQAVFGRSNVSDAQIGQIVLRARRVVDDDGHAQELIRTVPRFGFRWVAPTEVEWRPQADAAPAPLEPAPPDRTPLASSTAQVVSHAVVEPAVAEPAVAEAAVAEHSARRPPVRKRAAWLALALLLVAAVAAALWWWMREPAAETAADAPAMSLVLPTRVQGTADAAWARLGLMDFLADRLRRAGLAVPPSENTLVMLGRLGDAAESAPPEPGQRVIHSTATYRDRAWQVQLQARDHDRVTIRAQAEDADLLAAAGKASDRLLAALGHRPAADDADLGLQERLQRARAAMLANEVEGARRILLAAPELQRGSPELLYQLARIEFREGRFAQGQAGLDRALASRAGQQPLFRARLLNARGAMRVRLERSADAERDFETAAALVDPARHHAELAQSLTGRAVARAMQRRFDAALTDLGNARVQALRAGDLLAVTRIDANLGQLEMDRDRPAAALQYLQQAAADFEKYGAINELLIAHSALVAINLRLLRYGDARAQHERAWALRGRVRDPAQLRNLALDRAEILLRTGQLRAASALLEAEQPDQVPPGEAQRRAFLRVEAAWRAGDPRGVLRLAAAPLADPALAPDPALEGWLRLRRRQAALQEDAAPTPWPAQLQAPPWMAAMATALAERRAGRTAAADASYRQVLHAVEANGVPEDVMEAVGDYAPWLIARGRLAEASALVGRVAPWAQQDFDAALLQWRLYSALGQTSLAGQARQRVLELAGERPLPAGLRAAARAGSGD
jgi:DNA-binding winged helix-turn-helix (wHTH) protein/tetratricopeptide (TPR) repeat protein